MATTKKAVRFYAEPEVEAHLNSIPAQLRSNWINKVLVAAIEAEESDSSSELEDLAAWLKSQKKAPPLYAALADALTAFLDRD